MRLHLPSNQRLVLLILALFSLAATLPGLTTIPPIDRDEARFAQASAQMLESDNYINIRYQSEERNKKPAGIYWLQATSVSLFSSVEARAIWAYRLPSVLGGILAIFFTWGIGRTLFDKQTAFLAALFLGASPALMAEATIAKTDAMQLAALCGAMFGLARIYKQINSYQHTEHSKVSKWLDTTLMWFAIGSALLIKGPIVLFIVTTTILAIIFKPQREGRFVFAKKLLLCLKPVSGLLIVALCILPWAIAIGNATEGRFFTEALGKDLFGKLGTVQEHHSGPPGYHLLLLPVLFWSGAAFLPLTMLRSFQNRNNTHIWFLLSWLVPAWLIFEFTATKLPHYVLPLYPPIALLTAKAVIDLINTSTPPPSKFNTKFGYLGSLLFLGIGIGVAVAILILPDLYRVNGIGTVDIIFCIAIIGSALLSALYMWKRRIQIAALAMVAVCIFTIAGLFNHTLPSLDRFHISKAMATKLEAIDRHPLHSENAPPIIIVGFYEPSMVFQLGTDTQLIDSPSHALEALLAQQDGTLIVEQRKLQEIHKLVAVRPDIQLLHQITIKGFNYSKGDNISLTVYTKIQS